MYFFVKNNERFSIKQSDNDLQENTERCFGRMLK